MRVFVAGATGAIGQYLVPSLVAVGHEVTGTTRSPSKTSQLKDAGATPAVVDSLDRQAVLDVVRKRQMPVIGRGTGTCSFTEVTDAAAATAAAVTRGAPGIYNIVDDDPAPVWEWLPYLSECFGVKPPMRAPGWLGKLLAGEVVVSLMTEARGSSNAKARRELGWAPRYPSWRDGFPVWVDRLKTAQEAHYRAA
jgi:nucleoside-diphosphate-sugar epimerase